MKFTLARWLVPDRARVRAGDPIAEIETHKASVELPAWKTGTLFRIAGVGDEFDQASTDNTTIARID